MGSHPEVDAHYPPRRHDLRSALADIGARLEQVTHVTNCHLHFDHCGGNPLLADRPIFVQTTELSTARTTQDYTLPELVESGRYEEIDGEAEILPGVSLVPTPGHTAGHQSLVVRRRDGNVIVAGQSHDTASGYSTDVLSWRAGHAQSVPDTPEWIGVLQALDPKGVYFAHDHALWGAVPLGLLGRKILVNHECFRSTIEAGLLPITWNLPAAKSHVVSGPGHDLAGWGADHDVAVLEAHRRVSLRPYRRDLPEVVLNKRTPGLIRSEGSVQQSKHRVVTWLPV
jgi:N-acyl homoserine lactone hydrolase